MNLHEKQLKIATSFNKIKTQIHDHEEMKQIALYRTVNYILSQFSDAF